jgi:hypothetical protein
MSATTQTLRHTLAPVVDTLMHLATQTRNPGVSEQLSEAARIVNAHREADLAAVAELSGMEQECDENGRLLARLRSLVGLLADAPYRHLLECLVACMVTLAELMDREAVPA